jgi:two-component system, LytTR family, sensor kinase
MSPFIFSKQPAPRLARHLAFWGMYMVCSVSTFLPSLGAGVQIDINLFKEAFFNTCAYLPIYLLSTYFSLYYMLPRYLAHRKTGFLLWYIICSFAVTIPMGFFLTKWIFITDGYTGNNLDVLSMALQHSMADLITITGAALIIKILKDYYHEQKENELLVIENIHNKLQFQKMQLHPRLLFSSLQRIQLEIDADSHHAPEMILKLSDLLSYLLYESDTDRVLLSKEVSMINTYLVLKKLENKDHIEIRFQTNGPSDDLTIAPGLLLPLLEIGIEKGDYEQGKNQVTIALRTTGKDVYFSISNNMNGHEMLVEPFVQNTIRSVKDRLQSTYFQRFKLDILPAPESFTVILQVAKSFGFNTPKMNQT